MKVLNKNMKILNTKEATAFLNCGQTKLWQLIKNGSLQGTYYNIGCRRFFIVEKLENWIMEGGENYANEKRYINQ